MQFLHLAGNSKINSNRYYKVRLLFNAVNETFKQLPFQRNISIDESMIKYYGKHNTKQFIRGKPIRFGFKLFSLASPTGYRHHAELYCGCNTHLKEESYGLGGNVVLTRHNTVMCQRDQDCILIIGSHPSLLDRLKADGIGGTETIQANRCEKAPLQAKKELERKGRGSFSYASDGKKKVV